MEGTPNVVLEALASGRPAVATAVGGIPDVLADPRSGVLVPPRDPSALASGIASVLARLAAGEFPAESVRACGPASWRESAAALFDVLRGIHTDAR
jgi:glycosyltransferase involved in cell wall biosynthesis